MHALDVALEVRNVWTIVVNHDMVYTARIQPSERVEELLQPFDSTWAV